MKLSAGRIPAVLFILCSLLTPYCSVSAQTPQNMNVSATVRPKPTDFQLSVTGSPDGALSQGTEITYTITYGSLLTADSSPVSVQAAFGDARVSGITVPSLLPAEYISGSATPAPGNIEPVTDTLTHTITWDLPNLPANTLNQSVSFRAKLNDSYTGPQPVDFDLSVKLITPDITVSQTLTKTYLYHPATMTPTPTPVTSAGPTPSPVPLSIGVTNTPTVTDDSAGVTFTTSVPTTATIYFGTDPASLTGTVRSIIPSTYHFMSLGNLTADTVYYFYIVVTEAGTNRTYRSTLMVVRTARPSTPIRADMFSFIISSEDTIFNPAEFSQKESTESAVLTLPTDTEYGFQLRFPDPARVLKVQAILRNSDILGFSVSSLFPESEVQAAESLTDSVDMTEAAPGVYMGKLKTKPRVGQYDMVIRVFDIYGNITENVISKIQVVRPFTVLWAGSDSPVQNARIFLSRYNPRSDEYIPLSPTFLSAKNPVYTTAAGEATFVLPEGRYKAVITVQDSETTVEFSIDGTRTSGFPVVHIKTVPFTVFSRLRYYANTFLDIVLFQTVAYIAGLRDSIALYDLTGALSLAALVILTVLSFMSRTFMHITAIPAYVYHLVHPERKTNDTIHYITGSVIDGTTRKPISLAFITIMDAATNAVIATLQTDRFGHYFQLIKKDGSYHIQAVKRGYERIESIIYRPGESPDHLIHVLLVSQKHKKNMMHSAAWILSTVFGLCFEVLLGMSLLFELLFMEYFGVAKTIPYAVISLVNLLLWLLYVRHNAQHAVE